MAARVHTHTSERIEPPARWRTEQPAAAHLSAFMIAWEGLLVARVRAWALPYWKSWVPAAHAVRFDAEGTFVARTRAVPIESKWDDSCTMVPGRVSYTPGPNVVVDCSEVVHRCSVYVVSVG